MKHFLVLGLFFLSSLFVIIKASSSSSSSSSSSEDEQENDLLIPRETQPKPSTDISQNHHQLYQPTPETKELSSGEEHSTSLNAVIVPFSSVSLLHYPQRQRSIALCHQTSSIDGLLSPRISPIITQLNLIDTLLGTQFSHNPAPSSFLTGHLDFLKERYKELARKLGPLSPKVRNCAFRRNELVRFTEILSKYQIDKTAYRGRQKANFCSYFFPAVRKLNSLVSYAFMEYTKLVGDLEDSREFETVTAQLEPLQNELKTFVDAIDSFDLDLVFYCDANTDINYSIQIVREALKKFFRLAFN